jgi:L-asparaginase
MTKPTVALIATGGTIDSLGADRLDLVGYTEVARRIEIAELLARVPELADVASVEPIDFPRLRSSAVSSADWLRLTRLLNDRLTSGRYAGAVVTHGTNTMEETAYFLNLTLRTDRPVVLTGAMRPASAISSDGDLNLLRAVQVAAAPEAVGKGVLVVLNDTIHAARDVTKSLTYRVQAFESRATGPLGYADSDGGVAFYRRPSRCHTVAVEFDVAGMSDLPRVGVVLSHAGVEGVVIDALTASGVRGIVHGGTGAGKYGPLEGEALHRALASGVVVVQATRVGAGRVLARSAVREEGMVAADDLLPWKARILLMLGLTVTDDIDELQRMFNAY